MQFGLRQFLKIAVVAIVAMAVSVLIVAPFSKAVVEQWARGDVEDRARLAYNAIQGPVLRSVADGASERLGSILDGVAQDDRILAVGLCDESGMLLKPFQADARDLRVPEGGAIGRREFFDHRERRPPHPGCLFPDGRSRP